MHAVRANDSAPSLPPPRPKSPPEYPDLYGKRRELARIQVLEREIGFLQEEVKSAEVLQPASRSCKEVVDFVTSNADPLVPIKGKKIRKSHCLWKWLCGLSCLNVSWICRCCCSSDLEKPHCCKCMNCTCSNSCGSAQMRECSCSSCWNTQWLSKSKCSWNCCIPNSLSCLACSTIRCRCNCVELNMCSCNKNCCYSCCFCY